MNSRDIISLKKEILHYLSKRQLKDVFDSLMQLAITTQDWKISETLSELETNYKYMLHYLFEGVEDPERENVNRNLLRSLYELTDDTADELLKIESPNFFYERYRVNALKSKTTLTDYQNQLKEISDSLSLVDLLEEGEEKKTKKRELAIKRERIGSDMFYAIYVSNRLTEEDFDIYLSFLKSFEIPVREKCLFLSAITLSLFHRFDSRKVQLLMQSIISENVQERTRAMIGLVIVMQMYDVRWHLYPELQNQLSILSENPDFQKSVLRVIIQLIRSRETEQISKKIREEILPEMMKFSNLAGRKLNMEELMGETDLSEKNPEWQKELEESGLGKKLQEYSNLQMEGADVFHSTFAGLKNFPFFSETSNWFLPFDPSYSEISSLFPEEDKNNLLKAAVLDSGQMCNSDKYSFCLSLAQISQAQRDMMMGRMGAESEQIKELQKEAQATNPTIDDDIVSNQYIQDLYRFFKLNPHKNSFFDIFKLSLNFYDKKSIAPLISDRESMKKIALYCFDKNNFKEALDIFERLISLDTECEDIWQKIGYCKQMLDDSEGALNAYLQADLLKPNNSWIIKKIAHLYRAQKKPELSLEYYKKAAKLTPDNISIELNIGHCYLELNDYEQALNTYFKVELLDTKGVKALRPIAWTTFLLKKYDISQKYYKQILERKPNVHDYLNAGHVELCMKNNKEAISYYKEAFYLESDFEQLLSLFEADKEILISHGVYEKIFPFLYDQIKYSMN